MKILRKKKRKKKKKMRKIAAVMSNSKMKNLSCKTTSFCSHQTISQKRFHPKSSKKIIVFQGSENLKTPTRMITSKLRRKKQSDSNCRRRVYLKKKKVIFWFQKLFKG